MELMGELMLMSAVLRRLAVRILEDKVLSFKLSLRLRHILSLSQNLRLSLVFFLV